MYTASNLAGYIVSKCVDDHHPISNLQLQKILYYVQKTFLKERKTVAFNDPIEAWQFGPVVPKVYYEYSGYGAMPITSSPSNEIQVDDRVLVDQIIDEKRSLAPWDLVRDTHKPNGAWDKTYRGGLGLRDVIDTQLISAEG